MTSDQIQEQIETIRNATEKALQSKESATQFLFDAGIIELLPIEQLQIKLQNLYTLMQHQKEDKKAYRKTRDEYKKVLDELDREMQKEPFPW